MKPMTPLDRQRMGWVLLTLSLVGCARSDADALSSEEHMVQWEAMSGQFELVQDDTPASRATGALKIPLRESGNLVTYEGYNVRGTCGVTFISPEYAVTAAHCVNFTPDPDVDLIRVETYTVRGVDDPESLLQQAGTLDGDFPDYTRQTNFEDVADYQVESYDCNVAAFCSQPPHHCQSRIRAISIATITTPSSKGQVQPRRPITFIIWIPT